MLRNLPFLSPALPPASADWTRPVRRRVLRLPGRAARRREGFHRRQPPELPQRVLHLPPAAAGARQHRSLHRRRRAHGPRGAHRVPAGHGVLPTREPPAVTSPRFQAKTQLFLTPIITKAPHLFSLIPLLFKNQTKLTFGIKNNRFNSLASGLKPN